MQKLIKVLFRDNIIFFALGITIFIGYLSLKKVTHMPIQVTHSDKIFHAIAYFTLGLVWLLSFPKSLQKRSVKFAVVFSCVFYGIVLEVLQGALTAYRTASLLDVIANTIGVVIAMMLFRYVNKKIEAI